MEETHHEIEYLNANESYCHTCERTIPNAHVKFHPNEIDDGSTWECPQCGRTEHESLLFPRPDDPIYTEYNDYVPEVEIDVTCESVYITPVDGNDGFVFTHAEFEEIIEHFRSAMENYESDS